MINMWTHFDLSCSFIAVRAPTLSLLLLLKLLLLLRLLASYWRVRLFSISISGASTTNHESDSDCSKWSSASSDAFFITASKTTFVIYNDLQPKFHHIFFLQLAWLGVGNNVKAQDRTPAKNYCILCVIYFLARYELNARRWDPFQQTACIYSLRESSLEKWNVTRENLWSTFTDFSQL